jgi:hypothetical protein
MTKRRVEVEVEFVGEGRVISRRPNHFEGGVREPHLSDSFGFNVLPEAEDGEPGPPLAGTLQINVWGTGKDFRELGQYFIGLAELDASVDPSFHEHHHGLRGHGGSPEVNVIIRKLPAVV